MILHGFWRSLASYRVRIALNLKGIERIEVMHDLDAGDQHDPAFRAINPAGAVPALLDGTNPAITQSMAILEYLEETHPDPGLLPRDPAGRARVRGLCAVTVADSHPLVVPRVQAWLAGELAVDETGRGAWNRHWFGQGMGVYETALGTGAGRFCHGNELSLADLCLASHVAGAQRFGVDLAPFPIVGRVHAACMAIPAFHDAHPLRQPGAPG